jgi:DNA-binding Xre family transcriptional regulator
MGRIKTEGQITILMGKYQATTGKLLSRRRLARIAGVPKELVYRLDEGTAHYISLDALARLCDALQCRADEILVWEDGEERDDHGHSD